MDDRCINPLGRPNTARKGIKKMDLHVNTNAGRMGFAGGIILSTVGNLAGHDIIHTVLLAAIGAVSSFIMTLFCKWVLGYIHRKRGKG